MIKGIENADNLEERYIPDITTTHDYGKTEIYTGYDYSGNPAAVTDRNGNIVNYTYGVYGVTSSVGMDSSKSYTYNSMENDVSSVMNNEYVSEVVSNYTYDGFGRISQYSHGDETIAYTYDKLLKHKNSRISAVFHSSHFIKFNIINQTKADVLYLLILMQQI